MRSSYYSDRRFKRGSLAHELCSKIEVTAGKERQRKLPPRPGLLFSPVPFLSSIPFLRTSRLSFSSSPRRSRTLRLRSYEGGLTLLLFQRYIFSSHLPPSLLCFSFSRFFSISPFLSLPFPPVFSIRRFDPVYGAEGNSRNLLLGISWIIINAYAVAGGIDRPV